MSSWRSARSRDRIISCWVTPEGWVAGGTGDSVQPPSSRPASKPAVRRNGPEWALVIDLVPRSVRPRGSRGILLEFPMHHDRTLLLHGQRFHYTEWGDVSAPALLLLHGVTGHARTWDEEAAQLA